MQRKPLDQQVVVVVGASSGIGRETALQFAKSGAKVVISARDEAGLATLADQIKREGGQAVAQPADVSDFAQTEAIAAKAVAEFGRLDTWVHLAAVSIYAPFEKITSAEFKRVVEVNLLGQVNGALAALPYLRQSGQGALICVSSVEAMVALPFQSAYAASKGGVVRFLDTLRLELKHEHAPVSVVNIMPASINTPLFNQTLTRLGVKPMPVPPVYQPEVVAKAILKAAIKPRRDVIAGGAGKVLVLMHKLSPSLTDLFLALTAFRGQQTKTPKSDTAPNNLYEPLEGYDRVHGDFGKIALG